MRRLVNNFITKISHHKTYRKCCILPFHTQGGHSGGHLCPFRLSITCKLCCHVTAWLSSSLVVLCVLVLSNCSCLLFSSSFSFPGHNNSCQTMRTVHCMMFSEICCLLLWAPDMQIHPKLASWSGFYIYLQAYYKVNYILLK